MYMTELIGFKLCGALSIRTTDFSLSDQPFCQLFEFRLDKQLTKPWLLAQRIQSRVYFDPNQCSVAFRIGTLKPIECARSIVGDSEIGCNTVRRHESRATH